jgi:hypothetical protein
VTIFLRKMQAHDVIEGRKPGAWGEDDYAVVEGTLIGRIYLDRKPGDAMKWRWFYQTRGRPAPPPNAGEAEPTTRQKRRSLSDIARAIEGSENWFLPPLCRVRAILAGILARRGASNFNNQEEFPRLPTEGCSTMRISATILLGLMLAGCATQPTMTWIRADGQRSANNAVLHQQFEMDKTVCQGEMQKANLSGVTFAGGGIAGAVAAANRNDAVGQVARGCMAEKGYVLVAEEEAEQKRAELAAISAQKASAAAAQPVPVQSAKR